MSETQKYQDKNSAARLSTLMRKLLAVHARDGFTTGLDIWAMYLGMEAPISDEQRFEAAAYIREVHVLVRGVEADIRSWDAPDEDKNDHLNICDRFRQTLITNFIGTSNYKEFLSNQVNKSDVIALRSLASALSYTNEPTVDRETIAELLQDIQALIDEVRGIDLPALLKAYLLAQLDGILTALRRYDLFGVESLLAALPGIVSLASAEWENVAAEMSPEAKEVTHRVRDFAVKTASAVWKVTREIPKFAPVVNTVLMLSDRAESLKQLAENL